MIKLDLPPKPAELTDELSKELTEQFKKDGSPVWKRKFIVDAVGEIAFGKCSYSESILNEEGKYMEIDHFYCKSLFPEKVVEWGNLLPANKKCNLAKSDHNVEAEPIINPFVDNPKDHLYISNFRFYPKTETGKRTIDVVGINDRQNFVDKRYRIGNAFSETLSEIYSDIEENKAFLLSNSKNQNRLLNKIKGLLNQATRKNEYSATLSTVILTDANFPLIEQFLTDNHLWDLELSNLKTELKFCALLK